MIHSISSELVSFKALTFGPGLNILLADKSEGANDRQSRNGAGKTSFVELIHFLFGGNADKDSIFRSPELMSWAFEARVDVGGAIVDVTRSGVKPSRVRLQGDTSAWPLQPSLDAKTGDLVFTNEQWRALLGSMFFFLSGNDEGNDQPRFRPTFRSLFSYFARRQNSGGLVAPTQQASMQQAWDQQVAISYLLGLDARLPQEFQEVRTQEKAMAELRKAAKEGGLGRYFGTAADLRTRLTIAEARSRRLAEQLASFNVVPEYAEFEREASVLTRDISGLNDENTIDRELILQLRDAISSEQPPAANNLDRLYREAGASMRLPRFTKLWSRTVARTWPTRSKRPRHVLPTVTADASSSTTAVVNLWACCDRVARWSTSLDFRRRLAGPRRRPKAYDSVSPLPSGSRAPRSSWKSSALACSKRFRPIFTNGRNSSPRRSSRSKNSRTLSTRRRGA